MQTLTISIVVVVTAFGGVQCLDQFSNPDFAFSIDSDDMNCSFRGNGSEGVCLRVDQCAGAVSDFRSFRVRPTHCGFSGRLPVVCCATAMKMPITTTNIGSTSSATLKKPMTIANIGSTLIPIVLKKPMAIPNIGSTSSATVMIKPMTISNIGSSSRIVNRISATRKL